MAGYIDVVCDRCEGRCWSDGWPCCDCGATGVRQGAFAAPARHRAKRVVSDILAVLHRLGALR